MDTPDRHGEPRRLAALAFAAALVAGASTAALLPRPAAAANFSAGNIVVLRVGDGSAALSSAAQPVFLDELTTAGTAVQTIAMPTADAGANQTFTNSGTSTSEATLSRSVDGRYLALAGYDATPGTLNVPAAAVARVVARVDATGGIDTQTLITDGYGGSNIRSATTVDGTAFWTGGTGSGGGTRYVGFHSTGTSTQVSTSVTNTRVVGIAGGQLYTSAGSGAFLGISAVGTGTPTTSGQPTTLVVPTTNNPLGFAFVDRDATIPGDDTVYVAEQTTGLLKFQFDGSAWVARGSVTGQYTGVVARVNGANAELYATRGTAAGNQVVALTDTAAFDAPINATPVTIATAPANTVYRGLAFAPEGAPDTAPVIATSPASQTIISGASTTLTVAASGTAPLAYQWYAGASGDTSTPVGTNAPSFTTPALTATTQYWVRVTNSQGTADSATATVTVTEPVITPISTVQGNGPASPIVGQTVTVEGIVVGDFQGGQELQGYYVQEEDADADADPATSEGVFVFCNACTVPVAVGDVVRVNGTVGERFGSTQLTSTTSGNIAVLASGAPLPTPTTLTLPVPSGTTADQFYEPAENMLVTFAGTLTVSEYFELARYGQIELSAGGRPRQFTDTDLPSAAGYAAHLDDLARRTVILDDRNNLQNFAVGGSGDTAYFWPRPGLSVDNFVRGGDTIDGLTGVLGWTFAGQTGTDAWRVRPVEQAFTYAFTHANPRPAAPALNGLTVGAYNVLNFFLTPDTTSSSSSGPCGANQLQDCRGPDSLAESQRQREKLTDALVGLDADVLGLIELENTPGVDPLGAIVSDLNAALGAGTYAAIDTGVIGGDAIRVGIIYRPAAVTPVGAFQTLDANDDPRFRSDIMRPSLAQTFEAPDGSRFTFVVNHLKSKGCTDATGLDLDQLDGQGCWNLARTQAAAALADWLHGDPTGSGDPDVVVVGDMNSYRNEDPITTLEGKGFVDLIDRSLGADGYSYVFDGQLGYLDHALVSQSLVDQVTGVTEWHINADEQPLFDYNDTVRDTGESTFERESTALPIYAADRYRTSDHDPVLLGLDLLPPQPPTIDPIADVTVPEDTVVGPIAVHVGDVETDPGALTVTATSSNTALVPDTAIELGGSGADRTITLTPAANATGSTTITVTVADGTFTTTDTFVVTVTPVNDTPVANPDAATTRRNRVVAIDVLANDTDVDGGRLRITGLTAPSRGIVIALLGKVYYTPFPGFRGTDTFTYTVGDGRGGSATAAVTVTVT